MANDIAAVERAIKGVDDWIAEKARDYVQEQVARPCEFDYQSVHYILRSRLPIQFAGTGVPADLPCEVQVRTLLQHACSELTHDTIYKPNVQSTPSLKRAAAKSMALIEATSDYFSAVHHEIQATLAASERVFKHLDQKYTEWIGFAPIQGPLQSLIVDHSVAIERGRQLRRPLGCLSFD